MSAPTPAPSEWTRRPERGSVPIVRFMAWLSVAIGRAASRVPLRFIALYFFVTGGTARHHARVFLARALGRPPSLAEEFRLFFAFSTTIHDRIYFLRGRFDLFDIDVKGAEIFDNPDVASDIVALGRPQSMLELAARLEEGVLVGMMADRLLGDVPSIRVPFLGAEAAFPTGPMRIGAALRRRVIFMAGLSRGGNRYEIRFEPLADFTALDTMDRESRDRAVREGVAAFARRLEDCARDAPFNWFNFHDFWGRAS